MDSIIICNELHDNNFFFSFSFFLNFNRFAIDNHIPMRICINSWKRMRIFKLICFCYHNDVWWYKKKNHQIGAIVSKSPQFSPFRQWKWQWGAEKRRLIFILRVLHALRSKKKSNFWLWIWRQDDWNRSTICMMYL